MKKWEPYFGDRLHHKHDAGFVIIVPKEQERPTPLWCETCRMVMKTVDDTIYHRKYGCCFKCGMKWADQNQQKWATGWRPAEEDVKAEVEFRKSLPVSVDYNIFLDSL